LQFENDLLKGQHERGLGLSRARGLNVEGAT
jgi:hypothetical protein